jgi:hypothetical protein
MAIRDQAFDGHDHGKSLDLGGHAVARPFGVHVGDFPETGQDLVAAYAELAEFPGILLDELLLNGGSVFKQVGADTRLGSGVGGGIRIETDGFRGLTIGHLSSKDQAGKRYFLICDEVADVILRHSWVLFSVSLELRAAVFACAGTVRTQ